MNHIADNIKNIRLDIEAACKRALRDMNSVKLVAVSKRFPTAAILDAMAGGQILFGENYIQEASQKYTELTETGSSFKLHFIGNIQSNKAKTAAEISSMIETVDRLKLAKALNNHLNTLNKDLDILIQVNIGDDKNKSGVHPDEAEKLLNEINSLPEKRLHIRGLMTIPPFTEDPEDARPHFRALRILSEELGAKKLFTNNDQIELSMGMSNDYAVAIEEGATFVRIGTAIFGTRPAQINNGE